MSNTRHPRAMWVALFVTVAGIVPDGAQADEAGGKLALAAPETRQDRLIRIAGERAEHLLVECSEDKGQTWQPATIYHSDTIHDWQRDGKKVWDAGALKGFLNRGAADCLWNFFFDVPMPRDSAMLRFKSAKTGEVLQEETEAWRNVTVWMKQGDMLTAAIEEGRAAGLKVFADLGMNRTQIGNAKPHYAVVSEAQPKAHPEWLCKGKPTYLDYRSSGARDYVVSILREVLMKYGPDGVHCDYLRWPYRHAYDEASLLDVGKRIHEARLEAQEKWGHPILIATRIPSYKAERNDTWDNGYAGEHPEFLAALKVWASEGYIDRVMPASMGFTSEISLTKYHDAIAGTQVELWGNLYGHSRSGSYTGSVELARRWAVEGMDGGLFFYRASHTLDLEHLIWYLRMLDHPDAEIVP